MSAVTAENQDTRKQSPADWRFYLATWAETLKAGKLKAAIPSPEDLGFSIQRIHQSHWHYEKYQARNGIVAAAALIVAACFAISLASMFAAPLKGAPILPIYAHMPFVQLAVHVAVILAAISIAWFCGKNALSIRTYLAKHPEIAAVWEFCDEWSALASQYNQQIQIMAFQKALKEERLRQQRAAQQELENGRGAFVRELHYLTEARLKRIEAHPPEPIDNPQQVSEILKGIDKQILGTFFKLPADGLELFFQQYEERFGRTSAKFARLAFPGWKSGEFEINGVLAERIVSLAHSFMDSAARFDLIRQLRHQYRTREEIDITCNRSNLRERLYPALERIISHSQTTRLPDQILDRIGWLESEDTLATHKILEALEIEEARIALAYIEDELEVIDQIANSRIQFSFSERVHKFVLPQGTVTVTIVGGFETFLQTLHGMVSSRNE